MLHHEIEACVCAFARQEKVSLQVNCIGCSFLRKIFWRRMQSPEAAYKRQVVYVDRFDERNRGLLYLAAVTVAIVGIAGWFSPNVSQPFLF
jgi:hypothetical protein